MLKKEEKFLFHPTFSCFEEIVYTSFFVNRYPKKQRDN